MIFFHFFFFDFFVFYSSSFFVSFFFLLSLHAAASPHPPLSSATRGSQADGDDASFSSGSRFTLAGSAVSFAFSFFISFLASATAASSASRSALHPFALRPKSFAVSAAQAAVMGAGSPRSQRSLSRTRTPSQCASRESSTIAGEEEELLLGRGKVMFARPEVEGRGGAPLPPPPSSPFLPSTLSSSRNGARYSSTCCLTASAEDEFSPVSWQSLRARREAASSETVVGVRKKKVRKKADDNDEIESEKHNGISSKHQVFSLFLLLTVQRQQDILAHRGVSACAIHRDGDGRDEEKGRFFAVFPVDNVPFLLHHGCLPPRAA